MVATVILRVAIERISGDQPVCVGDGLAQVIGGRGSRTVRAARRDDAVYRIAKKEQAKDSDPE